MTIQITIDKETVPEKSMENGAESGEDEGEGNEADDVMAADDREYTYDEVVLT